MRETFAAIAVFDEDDNEDWVVQAKVKEAYDLARKLADEAGATPSGHTFEATVLPMEPIYDEDGTLLGHHRAVRVSIECELPEADVDSA